MIAFDFFKKHLIFPLSYGTMTMRHNLIITDRSTICQLVLPYLLSVRIVSQQSWNVLLDAFHDWSAFFISGGTNEYCYSKMY